MTLTLPCAPTLPLGDSGGEGGFDFCNWKMLSQTAEGCCLAGSGHPCWPLPRSPGCRVLGVGESSNTPEHHWWETEAQTAVHSQVALLAPGPSIQPGKSSQWIQAFSQPPSAGKNRRGPFLEPAQCLAHGKHLVNFARLKKNDSPEPLSEGPHSTSPFLRSLASTD